MQEQHLKEIRVKVKVEKDNLSKIKDALQNQTIQCSLNRNDKLKISSLSVVKMTDWHILLKKLESFKFSEMFKTRELMS